jgi:DNA-binding GntR family transcriptional regulator
MSTATRRSAAFGPMAQPSLVELVAADLRDAILSGRFRPGERVSDAKIAAEMGISRAPVREAIRQLAARGLVKEEPRRGAFVSRLTPSGARQVYDCRRALEGLAARRISVDADLAVHVARLREIVRDMERAGIRKDSVAMAEVDHRFHLTLCELTGNSWLSRLYGQLSDQSRLMQALDTFAHLDADARELVMRHEPIVDAIASGDPKVAEREVVAHIDLSERLFLSEVPDLADED